MKKGKGESALNVTKKQRIRRRQKETPIVGCSVMYASPSAYTANRKLSVAH